MRIPDAQRPTPHASEDSLLFFFDPAGRDEPIGFFNDAIGGRPFGEPEHISGAVHSVPLTGGRGAADVLRQLRQEGLDRQFAREPAYVDGTFQAGSKGVGHGLGFVIVPAPDPAVVPSDFPAPPPGLRRPVVALLDTGVRPHRWLLDAEAEGGPFLIDAERADQVDQPWTPGAVDGAELVAHKDENAVVTLFGHGTFIAGLIRQGAPSAQVLSIRVMSADGKAGEGRVCRALEWLLGYIGRGHPVDVVCMAFGRVPGDHTDQPLLDEMQRLLGELARLGVRLVASAGNDHQSEKIYPAAFDEVTAVGAGFGHYHANFSNFGTWVDHYRDGVDVLSVMPDPRDLDALGEPPGDRWARWSGTSFAAANFAADLAQPHVLG